MLYVARIAILVSSTTSEEMKMKTITINEERYEIIEDTSIDLFYGDVILYLTQEAHCSVGINKEHQWEACAIGSDGEPYLVKWYQYEDFNGDDASDACNWNDYYVEVL